MKKVLVCLLAIVAMCGCASNKGPKIEVLDKNPIQVTVGEQKSSYKEKVCAAIKLVNAAGEEVDCSNMYYASPVSTLAAGEVEFKVAFKDGDQVAEATLKMNVVEGE